MAAQKFQPKTKAQRTMLPAYRNKSPKSRMESAIQLVLAGHRNIAEAARDCGVTRQQLSVNVKEAREKLEEQQERSALVSGENRFSDEPKAPAEGVNEVRRVPPFKEFAETYFRNVECFDCGGHHPLPDFHVEMMEKITGPVKRLLINVPPGHSKSTIGTVQSTVYEICRDPNSITAIVSKSQNLAKKFLYQIGRYLTDASFYEGGPSLIDDWGPFQADDKQWSAGQMYVAGRQSVEKDPTVAAFGVGGHIYGIRAHRMIMDDVADLENQANLERVSEMLKWCTQEAGSRVGRNGKLVFIGTRVRNGDIYSELQRLPGYEVIRYPCIVDEDQKLTLWPDHFPFSAAEIQRDSMTAEQWQLVYQNVDTPGFGASFPPEVVELCRDPERRLGQYGNNWALIAGLDPAGANSQAGYTALVLLGVDLDSGRRYLVDMVNAKQLKAPQLRDQIFDWAERYPLRELRVESNGLQSQLVQYNDEIVARLTNRGVRVVPHITTKHNKWDGQFGVEAMATMFINQMISLPYGDLASRNRVRVLEEQLHAFPMGRASDLVMALWFAELGAKDTFSRASIPMFDPRFKAKSRLQRVVVDFADKTVQKPTEQHFTAGRSMFPPADPQRKVQMVNTSGFISLP